MKRSLFIIVTALVIIVVLSMSGFAQSPASPAKGTIVAPASTVGLPGIAVRTPLYIFKPDVIVPANSYPGNAETAGSIACIYGVTPPTTGCPKNSSPIATRGSKAIAVVEYGANSTLQADFNAFNTHFGLPAQTLQIICACSSGCPSNNGTGWDVETALDVEWSHAMAPNAQIIVSEFCNDPYSDPPPAAEARAGTAVAALGGGEVSNSFGYGGEFNGELNNDQYMTQSTVVYFASAGDSGLGPDYPSVSPNVISAGGTHIVRDGSGNFNGVENCWSGSGGGISTMEALPNYQLIIGNRTGPHRGTPDWAADADPNSGVGVYSTTGCGGWCQVGGTSLSSPLLAGIVNAAGSFANHTSSELSKTYGWYRNPGLYHQYFFDVTAGSNGAPAGPGWDRCTGLGAPRNVVGF
jgi:subtilase family serine protease